MGRAVVYCSKCQTRLTGAEFDRGAAFEVGASVFCRACAEAELPSLPAMVREFLSARLAGKEPAKPPEPAKAPAIRPGSTSRLPRAPAPPSRTWLYALIAGGALALLVVVVVVATSGAERPAPPPAVVSAPPPPPPPAVKEDATLRREMEEARREKEVARELAALDERVRSRVSAQEFGGAMEELTGAKPRYAGSSWTMAIDEKIQGVSDKAREAFGPVRDQAVAARKRNAADEVKALTEKVAKWGMPDLLSSLDRALADAAPPPPPAAPEVKAAPAETVAYSGRWTEAMALAVDRDFAGAIAILEAALREIQEKSVQAEAAGDLELVRAARTLQGEAVQALASWPKSKKLTVTFFDEAGKKRDVEGWPLRSGLGWMEIKRDKENVVVLFGEVAAKSLANGLAGKGDPRALSLLLAMAGDAAEAKKLPPKYGTLQRPPSGPRDAEARRRFFAAFEGERDYGEGQRRGSATAAYAGLLGEFGDTSFVRRNRELIAKRAEPAREYFFFAEDLAGSGTFRSEQRDKPGPCWAVTADVMGVKGRENFVEIEFLAAPDAPYRCWAYAGGCCAETYQVFWQGSELADTDAKTKAAISAEPGANVSLSLKPTVSGLAKSHAAHGGKPEPLKWGWVAVPLPKYAAAGPKKVRLLAERQGLAIAYVVVSAARTTPPSEATMKELGPARPAPGAAAAPVRDPSLIGWWKLDEGTGGTVADASGNGHMGKLLDGPAWSAGKVGKALTFDGKASRVEVADAPDLRLAGDFTVAFWMNKSAEHPDFPRLVGKGKDPARTFNVWEYGGASKTLVFQQFDDKGTGMLWLSSRTNTEIGQWYHVAAVANGDKALIYMNGVLDAQGTRALRPVGQSAEPLTFGYGGYHGCFPGVIDDVRLYNRALTADEVKAVFEGKR